MSTTIKIRRWGLCAARLLTGRDFWSLRGGFTRRIATAVVCVVCAMGADR